LYANSLIGVGVASSMYHSSRGRLRKFLRWVDYTMIATTTVVSNIQINIIIFAVFCTRKHLSILSGSNNWKLCPTTTANESDSG